MVKNGLRKFVLAAIPANLLNIVWDKIEPILDRVIEVSNRELTTDGVKRRALLGETLIVTICLDNVIIAVTVLDIVQFDSGLRAMYIPVVGGDYMDEWLEESFEVAKAIAKDFNCSEVRGLAARKGWLRRLKDMNWEEITTVIRCPVE
jgi:hypothetical protein